MDTRRASNFRFRSQRHAAAGRPKFQAQNKFLEAQRAEFASSIALSLLF
jgi:hypothetical protein